MGYDVIIIGGGPAGLTAAIYASRARLKTLLIENLSLPSQLILADHIENYPGFPEGINGFSLMGKFKNQAEKFGTEFMTGEVKSIKKYKDHDVFDWQVDLEDKSLHALSVIIASGAMPKNLNTPGEDKLRGKGVSYCGTCDGALFKDKNVVVIGGGDTAIEEALFLTKFAKLVTVIHRRSGLRATKILQERAFVNKKIEFIWDSVVSGISGSDRVSAVRIKNIKTNRETDFFCDGVFIFVGYMPNTDFIKDVIKLDKDGYIIADSEMKTNIPGIFACGDSCRKILRQVVTACGDGATSAFSCQHYLEELKHIEYK